MHENRRVQLDYRSPQGEVTKRGFDPYGVVSHEGVWYTIGYCHLRQGQRLFRLDRIVQVEMAHETFSLPVNFAVREAVQRALASVLKEWHIEVWLKTTLPEAQRSLRLSQAFFEEKRSGVLLRGGVDDLSWVAQKLAGLGIPFIIHQPQELRVVMSQYAQKLANYAQQVNTEGIEPDLVHTVRWILCVQVHNGLTHGSRHSSPLPGQCTGFRCKT